MKLKKILFSLVAILSGMSTALASTNVPSSYEVSGKDLYQIKSSKYLSGSSISMAYKKNTNGDIIYCTERLKTSVHTGTMKYTLSRELGADITYVMQNSYPNRSIFGNAEKDYFTTSLAIWYLVNPNDSIFKDFNINYGTYRGKDSDVVREMASLVFAAQKAKYETPYLKVSDVNQTLSQSSDGKYYVSENIGVSTHASTYNVSLQNAPSGTIVTDVNGNEKTNFKFNEKFIVKVPTASVTSLNTSFKVFLSGDAVMYKAYEYMPSNSKYQGTAALYPSSTQVNDTITLNITKNPRIEISKVDATTGKELEGAHLVLKDSNNNIIDEWTSTKEVHIIEKNITPGKYTLTETIAPEGYELSTETITFEVKDDGSVTKVVMENKPKKEVKEITISKQDVTTGKELAGASLELRDESGKVIYAWVSTDEPFVIKEGLAPGKYTLAEVLAPEGYELNKESVVFTVNADGSVDGKIVIYNKPETVIDVPSTSSFKTITTSIIGLLIIGLGSLVIYRNYKKNEEV